MGPEASDHNEHHQDAAEQDAAERRRRFLKEAGRFALATPPAITLLLAADGTTPAWASGGVNNGIGNGNGGGRGHGHGKP